MGLAVKNFLLFSVLVFLVGCQSTTRVGDVPIVDSHMHLYDSTRKEGIPWWRDGRGRWGSRGGTARRGGALLTS